MNKKPGQWPGNAFKWLIRLKIITKKLRRQIYKAVLHYDNIYELTSNLDKKQ